MRDFRLPLRSRKRRALVSNLNQLWTRVKKKKKLLRISFGKFQWLSTSFLNLESKSVASTISLCASYLVCKTLLSKHLTSVCWKVIRKQLQLEATKIVRSAIHTPVMKWTCQRSKGSTDWSIHCTAVYFCRLHLLFVTTTSYALWQPKLYVNKY